MFLDHIICFHKEVAIIKALNSSQPSHMKQAMTSEIKPPTALTPIIQAGFFKTS